MEHVCFLHGLVLRLVFSCRQVGWEEQKVALKADKLPPAGSLSGAVCSRNNSRTHIPVVEIKKGGGVGELRTILAVTTPVAVEVPCAPS